MTTGNSSVPANVASVQDDLSRIPRELRERHQWCLADPDKAPRTVSGVFASSTDPSTWSTFDAACAAAHERGWHIGYMLTADDPFACIDLDVKDSTTAEQWERFNSIVQHLDSYSELSRSGRGMHVWVQGKIGTGCKRDGVEVYSQERFIICTGKVYNPRPIEDRHELLTKLVSEIRVTEQPTASLADSPQVESDDELLEKARGAANAAKFNALWEGHHQYPSQSEADLALLGMLAFYSPNNEQARRLFRMSGLGKREKATKDDRYLNRTLSILRGRDSRTQQVEHGRQLAEQIYASWLAKQRARSNGTQPPLSLDALLVDWDLTEPQSEDLVDGLIADEEVTLLGGHGGIGKGFLALQLAVAVATGTSVFGRTAGEPKRVVYYSAEDGRKRIGARMRRLLEDCTDEERALAKQNLRVVDASELDPLFGRIADNQLGTMAAYAALRNLIESFEARLVVADGASDTFDGNEIVKREVMGFVRALKRLHPSRRIGVLLIVHIDRASARGITSNDEGYSGNVAWHNACRRRMYLQKKVQRDEETKEEIGETITLRVLKNQDAQPAPDMEVMRQQNGFWQPAVTFGSNLAERGGDYAPLILRLIGEYYQRGKWISTSLAPQSTKGVYSTLTGDPDFPPISRKQTDKFVRQLEREQKLEPEEYRRDNGGKDARWKVK